MKLLFVFVLIAVSAAGQAPSTPPAGHIQCWQAERPDHSRHLMCGDSWGSLVDVTEALEKKHEEFCKTIPNTNGATICNGAAWYPGGRGRSPSVKHPNPHGPPA